MRDHRGELQELQLWTVLLADLMQSLPWILTRGRKMMCMYWLEKALRNQTYSTYMLCYYCADCAVQILAESVHDRKLLWYLRSSTDLTYTCFKTILQGQKELLHYPVIEADCFVHRGCSKGQEKRHWIWTVSSYLSLSDPHWESKQLTPDVCISVSEMMI